MPDDDAKNNEETYGINKSPLRDYLLWILISAVIVFGFCWFFSCLKWILIPLIVVMGVCLGFGLPGWQGWKERQKRARKAKKEEEEKWGFHSLEREGPWINYIDYPLVKETKYASGDENDAYTFYSEWLIIQDGYIMVNPGKPAVDLDNNTVTYDFTDQRGYAWDGCTPKKLFYWLAVIGTPDWFQRIENILMLKKEESNDDYKLETKKVFWQQAHHASLVHDVLYQYLDNIPISKENVDKLFRDMLKESGVFFGIRWLYYFGVWGFAGWGIQKGERKEKSDFTVKNFPEFKLGE